MAWLLEQKWISSEPADSVRLANAPFWRLKLRHAENQCQTSSIQTLFRQAPSSWVTSVNSCTSWSSWSWTQILSGWILSRACCPMVPYQAKVNTKFLTIFAICVANPTTTQTRDTASMVAMQILSCLPYWLTSLMPLSSERSMLLREARVVAFSALNCHTLRISSWFTYLSWESTSCWSSSSWMASYASDSTLSELLTISSSSVSSSVMISCRHSVHSISLKEVLTSLWKATSSCYLLLMITSPMLARSIGTELRSSLGSCQSTRLPFSKEESIKSTTGRILDLISNYQRLWLYPLRLKCSLRARQEKAFKKEVPHRSRTCTELPCSRKSKIRYTSIRSLKVARNTRSI